MNFLAQKNIGTFEGLGPLGTGLDTTATPPYLAIAKFIDVISKAIGVLTVSAGIWFIIQIFIGAFKWLVSGGEKQALQNAQKHITNAILGLFVVVISYALISLIGLFFGIDMLNIKQTIINLAPKP